MIPYRRNTDKNNNLLSVIMLMTKHTVCHSDNSKKTTIPTQDIVILYTNDVHCAIDEEDAIGYAGLADIKKHYEVTGAKVLLVDAGDSIQGGAIGAFSKGSYIIDIMNEIGYDISAVGNHEFDYGTTHFIELSKEAKFPYISCNIRYKKNDTLVFPPYKIFEVNDIKIAFVGITTPDTPLSSSASDFEDENGNMIYSFGRSKNGQELYARIQQTVDDIRKNGADYVIALAHLGEDEPVSPWSSINVIANTTGIDVMLDGHSHNTMECDTITNKTGDVVLLTQTGTKLSSVGVLELKANGSMTAKLISDWKGRNEKMAAFIQEIQSAFDKDLKKVIGNTNFALIADDSETGASLSRYRETNLGDFCTDAYRFMTGADIAMDNGGGIRANINEGPITFEEIFNVKPFGNLICVAKTRGQNILDALEMGSAFYPEENGLFLQVSGISFEIDSSIESSVILDEDGKFVSVEGQYRVKNVMVGKKPLDVNQIYTLASHDYFLKDGGSGYTMFTDTVLLQDNIMPDNQILANYLTEYLHGIIGEEYSNPYGKGRIRVR